MARILVLGETSGKVRDAFLRLGHDAMSADILPTNVVPLPAHGYRDNQTPSGQNKLGPSKQRWDKRSETYTGIANAMAAQWHPHLPAPEKIQFSRRSDRSVKIVYR